MDSNGDNDISEVIPEQNLSEIKRITEKESDNAFLLRLFKKGLSPKEILIKEYVDMSKATVYRKFERFKVFGNIERIEGSGRKASTNTDEVDTL